MPINLIRSRSINYIQRKWFHYQTFIYLGYTPVRSLYSSQRLLVISATRAFLRSFAAINLFIAASRFSQNSLSNVSIIVLLLNSLIAICRKNTLFPRNHQENQKKSASYLQITTKSIVNYKLLTVNYKLLSHAVPARTTMARALMPRQPYSVAVPSDEEERFSPSPLRVRGSG